MILFGSRSGNTIWSFFSLASAHWYWRVLSPSRPVCILHNFSVCHLVRQISIFSFCIAPGRMNCRLAAYHQIPSLWFYFLPLYCPLLQSWQLFSFPPDSLHACTFRRKYLHLNDSSSCLYRFGRARWTFMPKYLDHLCRPYFAACLDSC